MFNNTLDYFLFITTKLSLNLQARFNVFNLLLHSITFSLLQGSLLLYYCFFLCVSVCFCVYWVSSPAMSVHAYVKWPSFRLLGPERHKAETGAKG